MIGLRLRRWLPALLLLATGCGSTDVERIVVVTFDTTRATRLGCYGYERAETPNLDAFAAESVLFEHAVSPVPTTLPSHSTMFTGLYPQDHGVRYNLLFRLGPEALTLAEVLSAEGFATGGFPATFILDTRFGLNQGFETYADAPRPDDDRTSHRTAIMRHASDGVDLALDWLSTQPEKAFVWLHFYDPHWPYTPPFPYSSRFRDRPYDGELAYADSQFGRFLAALREDPMWDRTAVIVAGDHGEGLYEHDERFHATLVYEATQHVPLIVRSPGVRAGRVSEPVGLVDLMPTVLDLVGVEAPPNLRGVSLAPALRGEQPERRDLYFESHAGSLSYGWAQLSGLRYGRWKLIDSSDPELFDLEEDPAELRNLATLEPNRLQDLRAALETLAQPISDETPAVQVQDEIQDPETAAFLASLGYVGSVSSGSAEGAPHPRYLVDMEGELLAAQMSIQLEEWQRLEDLAAYVLDRDPTNKWMLQALAIALLSSERPREAQDTAAELLGFYPDNEKAYELLAESYSAQKQHATAYDVIQRGREVLPESFLLAYLSLVTAFEAERPAVCSEEVPAIEAGFPGKPPILVMKARCAVRAGDEEGALAALQAAVDGGFKRLGALEETDDFAELSRDARFKEMLASAHDGEAGGGDSGDSASP